MLRDDGSATDRGTLPGQFALPDRASSGVPEPSSSPPDPHSWDFWSPLRQLDVFVYRYERHPEPRCSFASQASLKVVGYTPEELYADPSLLYALVHPDDLPALKAQAAHPIPELTVTFRCRHKDGRWLWLEQQNVAIFDDTGRVVAYVGKVHDITVHKEMEDALRGTNTLVEGILNSALDGISAFRSVRGASGEIVDFEWLHANPAAASIVGREGADLVGKRLLEVLPGTREEGLFGLYVRVVETGAPVAHEHYYEHEGIRAWFREVVVKLEDGFAVTFSDITDHKQSEQHLHRLNRTLTTISECGQVLIRAPDERTLLRQICRTVVHMGGYAMAWVGLVEESGRKIERPAGWGRDEAHSLDLLDLTWDDAGAGQDPVETAIRTGRIQIVRDTATGGELGPSVREAFKRGHRSLIALPLRAADAPAIGALVVCSAEPDVFTAEEVALLLELAGDIAYGVGALRLKAKQEGTESALREAAARFRRAMEGTVGALATVVEMRDPYTAGHQRRVGSLAAAIAERMDITADHVEAIRLAGMIHDIGKITVPAEILSKPGKIGDIESRLISAHAESGYDIVKDIDFPWPIAAMVLQHHERLDGSGYPRALSSPDISIGAKILAVADVVEAMASNRPYRPALGLDAALQEILKGRGTLYDTGVVDACLHLFSAKAFAFD